MRPEVDAGAAGSAQAAAIHRGPRLWLRTFVGFYPPHSAARETLDPVAGFSVFCPAASSWVYIAGLALGAITRALRAG